MTTAALPGSDAAFWPRLSIKRIAVTRAHAKAAALTVVLTLAFGLRVGGLSTYGLSEDEVNKVEAITRYRAGDFSANVEHPMLMKLAMWGSVEMMGAWNRIAPPDQIMSLETAIRLPNALAGSATTVAVFGVAQLLFGEGVAVVAALLWALDVNAIAINRIGKEDTFLLLFFLVAIWCYERAKQEGVHDPSRAQRWYTSSGAAFGLMLASKYMPLYVGVYALFNAITDRNPGRNKPTRWRFYGAMLLAFVAANSAVLMPQTWRYCSAYVQGRMLSHHGYLYAGQLYVTNIPVSPLGVPLDYYFRFIATKVPLVVLAALIPGVTELIRRRDERGFVLLRVLAVLLLVSYSVMAAKFIRYALPILAVVDLIAAVGAVAGMSWVLRRLRPSKVGSRFVRVAVPTIAIAALSVGNVSVAPFYSSFQNVAGSHLAPPGLTFPEETYDYGVREAVAVIARSAPAHAVIVSDAPGVVSHYLLTSGRSDLRVRSLSREGLPGGTGESWVIVQDEHMSFENQLVVGQLRRQGKPWREFRTGETLAAQIFRIGAKPCCAIL
jgi:hypothetical protein